MTGAEVLQFFDTSFKDDFKLRRLFLKRLEGLRDQDPSGADWIRQLIQKIEDHIPTLSPHKQRSADGTIGLLVLLLEEADQRSYAADFLLHSRRSRRATGHKIVRRTRLALTAELTESYTRFGDREGLVSLLLGGHNVLPLVSDVESVLADLNDRYYQTLLIERLLDANKEEALALASEFPMAFLWAIGRQERKEHLDFVLENLQDRLNMIENLPPTDRDVLAILSDIPLFFWAMERLGAVEDLAELAKRYRIDVPWPFPSP